MQPSDKGLEITISPQPEDIAILDLGLHAAYGDAFQPYQEKQIGIFKRDAKRNVIAGLYGKHYWGWLYIDMLWVASKYRKTGLGRELILAAEKQAHDLGLLGIYLWAQEGLAGAFYDKLGFAKFVEIPDFPPGHKRLGYIKRFSA